MNSRRNKLSIIIAILLPIFVFGYFLLLDIRPSGKLQVTFKPGSSSYYIKAPLPESRRELTNEGWRIIGEPIYLPVRSLGPEYISLNIRLHIDPGNAPLISFGPRMDMFTGAADLRPVYFAPLENVSHDANLLESQTLYSQSERLLQNVLRSPRERGNVRTFFANESIPYRSTIHQAGTLTNYDVDLRGAHRFYSYIHNEPLVFRLSLTDMNRAIGRDDVVLRVVDESEEVIFEESLRDDGNERQDQRVTEQRIGAELRDLEEGVYRIEFVATSDHIIRSIETNASKLVIAGRLYSGDGVGYRINDEAPAYYGRSDYLRLETPHADGVQTVTFGERRIQVAEPLTQYEMEGGSDVERIQLERRNMKIVGTGYFALTQSQYFEPYPPELSAYTRASDLSGLHILSTYERVQHESDGSIIAELNFPLQSMPVEEGFYRFVLSIPSVREGIILRGIDITYEKSPTHSFADIVNALKTRLPFY